MKTVEKFIRNYTRCLTCSLKDVKADGIYCTCGHNSGDMLCVDYFESTFKRIWFKKVSYMTCEVYGENVRFFAIHVDNRPVCVSLYVVEKADDLSIFREVVTPALFNAGVIMTLELSDLIVDMFEACKEVEV